MHGWLTAHAQPTAHNRASFTAYLGSAILLALPLAVACGSLATWQVHGVNITATDALVALLVAVSLRSPTDNGAWPTARHETLRPAVALTPYRGLLVTLVALIVLMALSLVWAADRVLALKELLKWSEALAVLAVAPRWLRRPGMVAGVVAMVLAVACVEACLGGLQ
ncbi:MAG: hypothetical protein H0X24_21435, partial [Ktedonobacterales bacterium]|nr:hypothetical protein [Ktedonobacterales bacterium]